MPKPKDIALLDRARVALEKATDLAEVADIRSQASALSHYLRRCDGAEEAARRAIEIRLRAERRLGQLLAKQVQHRGGKCRTTRQLPSGISRDQSSSWQRIAALPAEVFEGALSNGREPTTAALVRLWRYRYQAEPDGKKGGGTVKDLARLARTGRRFGTVYADPPWEYGTAGVRRSMHYDRMGLDDIKALPIEDLAHRDAHLWLWTTNAHIPQALEVVDAWGFTHRTMLTWAKSRMGIGWWLRSKTEHVIFAARTKRRRVNPGKLSTLHSAPTREHSRKPDGLYDVIETLSPGPYIELFARGRARRRWTAWGDEVARGAAPPKRRKTK